MISYALSIYRGADIGPDMPDVIVSGRSKRRYFCLIAEGFGRLQTSVGLRMDVEAAFRFPSTF
jgi:hypothetical protein